MPKCVACKKVASFNEQGHPLCLDHYVELKMANSIDRFLEKYE